MRYAVLSEADGFALFANDELCFVYGVSGVDKQCVSILWCVS